MEDWDQETLEKVVESKKMEYNQNKPTEIVCKAWFFGLGEMGEREIVGGEMRERGILVSKAFLWLMLIEVCLGG